MVKFIVLLFRYLPNEAHHRFFEKVTRELPEAGADVLEAIGTKLITELNKWFAIETANLEWMRKSLLTAAITEANSRLDRVLAGLSAQIKVARYSDQPDAVVAAGHLHTMLHNYGDVARKPYLQKIEAVLAIIKHLKGDFNADVQTIGAAGWIAKLEDARSKFVNCFEQRETQSLEKPKQGFRETRRELDKIWRQIVFQVNAGVALHFSDEFARFIDTLNPEIEYLNREYHHAKTDIAAAEPAPIPPQPYTGYPCTPVPEVLFVSKDGTAKLELGKDFGVSYHKNVNVGNAECRIHGKGAYRGKKTVTFIIAR